MSGVLEGSAIDASMSCASRRSSSKSSGCTERCHSSMTRRPSFVESRPRSFASVSKWSSRIATSVANSSSSTFTSNASVARAESAGPRRQSVPACVSISARRASPSRSAALRFSRSVASLSAWEMRTGSAARIDSRGTPARARISRSVSRVDGKSPSRGVRSSSHARRSSTKRILRSAAVASATARRRLRSAARMRAVALSRSASTCTSSGFGRVTNSSRAASKLYAAGRRSVILEAIASIAARASSA